ncbi:MAG: DNA polymerase III subunit gamma/tau [Candidatus Magnetomorum sp.]|nr:DNA polymerase III subunit gamma/tau [Candidatus Magnetomorum sp.]
MSYLVLARKYRPSTFKEVVEQSHVTQTLQNAVQSGRLAHAILFSGPRGTGKTTVARVLAKAMNCYEGPTATPCNQCRSCKDITAGNAVDVMEVDGASNNGVENIRDLRDKVQYRPAHSRYKIYIIDEVHMLSTAAFNALLKTLEEPPEHVLFMFATTEPHKIPITILSRCQRHDLRRIKLDAITNHLQKLCDQEHIPIKSEFLSMVAREAGGSMRDALSLLDQVMVCVGDQGDHQNEHDVLDILGVLDRKIIFSLSTAIIDGNIPDALDVLHDIYDRGHDLKKMIVDLIEHFRNLLIVKLGKKIDRLINVPFHEIDQMKKQVENITPHYINQIFDGLFQDEIFVRYAPQPRLALEKTLIKIASIQPVLDIDTLIEKIDQLQETIGKNPNVSMVQSKSELRIPAPQPIVMPPQTETPHQKMAPEPSRPAPDRPTDKSLEKDVSGEEKTLSEKKIPQGPVHDDSETLDTTWSKLITRIRDQVPSTAPLLKDASLKNYSDNTITIEINGPPFVFSRVKEKHDEINRIINSYFQKSVSIEWLQGKAAESALEIQKKRTEQEQKLRLDARKHPLVQEAVRLFNGKIIDVKLLNS